MKTIDEALYENLADAYAFFGNSFLPPMTRIPPIGLEPAFWEEFPSFLSSRLLRWTPKFEERILQDTPDGYYLPLTVLLLSVLRFHETALREA